MSVSTKKKVSFDIESDLLDEIKKYCVEKKMKQSDFFREASKEKLKNDEEFITILVPENGSIQKFVVNKKDYEIDIFDASEEMRGLVGAKKEGVLRLKDDDNININSEIYDLWMNKGKVNFFIK